MNNGITINSELDLYEKGGNSAQARWITEKILNARKLGIISEVELAVLDTALSDDFGTYKAYQAGLNQQSDNLTIAEQVNDVMDRRKIEPKKRGEYPSHHFPHHFPHHQSW
jgi:hypothetical protein